MFPPAGGGRSQHGLVSQAQAGTQSGTLAVSTFPSFRAKYFRGKRLHTDWDIKVDQVEFKDLSVSASSSEGVTANIKSYKSGTANIT